MRGTSTASSSSPDPSGELPEGGRGPTEAVLRRLGIRPSRRFGQSFLTDPFVADAEVALLGLRPGVPVLEVGGGLGLLSAAILRRGLGPLTVIERDPRLAAHLRQVLRERATVVEGDALRVPLPPVRAAIGNLPYSAATAILERLLDARIPRLVAMVQREVAARFAAVPGTKAYGRLTIRTAALATVERFRTVGPEAFVPPPTVESQLVAFTARAAPAPIVPLPDLEAVLDPLFASRRKQLANLLPRLGPRAAEWAEAAGWPTGWRTLRPEDLPPEAYFRLAEEVARGRRRPAPAGPGAGRSAP